MECTCTFHNLSGLLEARLESDINARNKSLTANFSIRDFGITNFERLFSKFIIREFVFPREF